MSRFARVAAFVALVAALCCRVQAGWFAGAANFDPVRMFNPASESLLSGLLDTAPKTLSPLAVALFDLPNPAIVAIAPAPPIATSSGSGTVSSVALRAYTPPVELPAHPIQAPSVTPAAPVQHIAQVEQPVHVAAAAPQVRFGAYTPYAPSAQSLHENVQVPVRVGAVHFSGVVSSDQSQTVHADAVRAMQLCGTTDEAAACPYLHDERSQTLAAGTKFNLRAGNTQLNLQLSGSVGRVSTGDTSVYQYTPLSADPQLDAARAGSPEDSSLLYYPGLTDIVRHGLNASVAVPVSSKITIGLQYDRAHYQGNYGALFTQGLDARKDTYLGNVTYQLPNSSSLLTLSARQYRYQDSFAPNFNLTETRADLSFTVKF